MHTRKAPWPAGSLLATGAEALWTQGDLTASRGWFDAAWVVAEHRDDASGMAAAALGLAGLWVHERHINPAPTETTATAATAPPDIAATHDRLRQALAAVPADGTLALRLRARLAAEADYPSGGNARITACLEEARSRRDPIALAEALTLAHHCLLGPEHSATRRMLAEELIAESSRTARRGDLLIGLLLRGVDLLLDADPHARRCLTELRGMLEVQDHLAVRSVLQAIDVMTLIRAGQFTEAETAARQCADGAAAAGNLDAPERLGAQLTAIRWFQGRIGELLPPHRAMTAVAKSGPAGHSFQAVWAVAAASVGRRRDALGAMAAFRDGLAAIPSSGSRLLSWYALAEAAWLLDRTDVAAEAYELLLPHRRQPMMAGFGVACFGSVEHALGVASLTLGDHDGAVDHLRRAVRDNQALGHWPAATLADHRLSLAMAQSSDPEHRATAAHHAEAAIRDAAEFGMTLPSPPDPAPAPVPAGSPKLPSSSPDGPTTVVCRRVGKAWQVVGAGRGATVGHSRGMAYLAVLLANPGREISAVELAGGPAAVPAPDGTNAERREAEGLGTTPTSQPILDAEAIRRYRARLDELDKALEGRTAETAGSAETTETAEVLAERQWLRAELRAATGLTGRPRVFSTTDERARIAVGKAIRRALARVTEADAELGALLTGAVRTGRACSYRPAPEPGGN